MKHSFVCSVYFTGADGRLAGHVTNASSLFEAVRNAWQWTHSTHWQGPRPTLDTIFDVQVSSKPEKYRVLARRALEAAPSSPTQPALFLQPIAGDAFDPR